MHDGTPLEAVLKRDRAVLLFGLAGVSALAWIYMLYSVYGSKSMGTWIEMTMPHTQAWTAWNFVLIFIMWAVMMVAMMIPVASPLILTFAAIIRGRREKQNPELPVGMFLLGYLVVWTGFSALASTVQLGLHSAALLSALMANTNPVLGGAILLAAGIFQWTPIKDACLTYCRSPVAFFMTDWREGRRGALVMGLKHGSYCVGCCWLLMILLFVTGVMNLLWMAIITVFVLFEKLSPAGRWVSRIGGLVLMGWGTWKIAEALF